MVEIVEQSELKEMERSHQGAGGAPFHPALLLSVLTYGYATGIFSGRKSAPGFRQFLPRGLENVNGEWNSVALARNLKRVFVMVLEVIA